MDAGVVVRDLRASSFERPYSMAFRAPSRRSPSPPPLVRETVTPASTRRAAVAYAFSSRSFSRAAAGSNSSLEVDDTSPSPSSSEGSQSVGFGKATERSTGMPFAASSSATCQASSPPTMRGRNPISSARLKTRRMSSSSSARKKTGRFPDAASRSASKSGSQRGSVIPTGSRAYSAMIRP